MVPVPILMRGVLKTILASSLAAIALSPAVDAKSPAKYTPHDLIQDVFKYGSAKRLVIDSQAFTLYTAKLPVSVNQIEANGDAVQQTGPVRVTVMDVNSDADGVSDLNGEDKIKFDFNLGYCGNCKIHIEDKPPFFTYDEDNDKMKDTIRLAPNRRPDKTYDPETAQKVYDSIIKAVLDARSKGVEFLKR
jgi:hypothetical protein